jgi:TetR/AcrR family transcriptional regulator, transcriptional repressor for nem operon
LRRPLRALVDASLDPARSRGCFAGNAAVERGGVDEQTRRLTSASFAAIRRILAEGLEQARENGELRADADPEASADLLLVLVEGLHVVSMGTRDRRLATSAIDAAVDQL